MKTRYISIVLIAIMNIALGIFWRGIIELNPTGYQLNVYSQLGIDVIFGFLVIFTTSMVLHRLTDNRIHKSVYLGIFLITYFTILLSPRFLGYYLMDRGDSLQSVGYIRTILLSGHTDKLDIYPAHWIVLGIVKILSGLSLDDVILLSIVVNNFVYVLFFLIFSNKFNVELLVYFGFGFLLEYYHETIIAEYFAYVLNLVIVYLLLKVYPKLYKGIRLVLTIFLVTTIFAHPFIAFFNLGLLILLYLSTKLTNVIPREGTYSRVLLVYSIVLVVWISWQRLLISDVVSIPLFIKEMVIFKQLSYSISTTGTSTFDLLKYSIVRYWSQIWLYVITLTILILFIKTLKNVLLKRNINRAISPNLFSLLLALWSLVFTGALFLMKHGYDRILGLNFMIIGAVVLISELYPQGITYKWQHIISLISILILSISVFGLFYSPLIGMPNIGITYGELTGVKFALVHLDNNSKIIDPIGEASRWSTWRYGYSKTFTIKKILYLYKLPDHFGYMNVTCFVNNGYIERIEHDIFGYTTKYKYNYTKLLVVVPDYPIRMYEEAPLFRRVKRFTYEDENRLRSDYSVDLVYIGANLRVYRPISCN